MAQRVIRHDSSYGTVGDPPPSAGISRDVLVSRLHAALDLYVTAKSLGQLWSGVEIVLDQREGVILQPDITFVVDGRESIVSDRVAGPPDMVLEVTSRTMSGAPATRSLTIDSRPSTTNVISGCRITPSR